MKLYEILHSLCRDYSIFASIRTPSLTNGMSQVGFVALT